MALRETNVSAILRPRKIVSGGQTGVDRAALDVAMELGIPYGGWCPRGRKAEDGVLPDRYRLTETSSADYSVRTRRNIVDSDGTLLFFRKPLEGGSRSTYQTALALGKPVFLFDLDFPSLPPALEKWMLDNHIETLNIAGPRESRRPGIYEDSRVLMRQFWKTRELHVD